MNNPSEHSVFALRIETDTAYPQEMVPIYLIHTIENPFCSLPGCWCQTDQERIIPLLEQIKRGEMTLREAVNFVDGRRV